MLIGFQTLVHLPLGPSIFTAGSTLFIADKRELIASLPPNIALFIRIKIRTAILFCEVTEILKLKSSCSNGRVAFRFIQPDAHLFIGISVFSFFIQIGKFIVGLLKSFRWIRLRRIYDIFWIVKELAPLLSAGIPFPSISIASKSPHSNSARDRIKVCDPFVRGVKDRSSILNKGTQHRIIPCVNGLPCAI